MTSTRGCIWRARWHRLIVRRAVVDRNHRGTVVHKSGGVPATATRLRRTQAKTLLSGAVACLPPHEHRERILQVDAARRTCLLTTSPTVEITLEQILASDSELSVGALVTMLTPVLRAMHDAAATGVHLAPTASTIALTAQGRPVLLLETEAAATAEAALAAILRLSARCKERCPRWPIAHAESLGQLEALLYRAAPPLPVAELIRATIRGGGSREAGVAASTARHRRSHPWDNWLDYVVRVTRRRRGPIITGVVIVLGAVVASVPCTRPATGETTMASPAPGETANNNSHARDRSGAPSNTVAPAESGSSPQARAPRPELSPEEAATALIAAAAGCNTSACSSRLTTADSPLRAAGTIRLLADSAKSGTVLADTNGGSAVVVLKEVPGMTTASVLMIRTEAGWLIRDVYTGDGP
ncbi:hypothetical protein [Rathayibacter toxicus]|uniref:hypothetical protein n=1 Tax=Rathayibacter toxicus TaxID=145458 RepID=UPI00041DF38F|nr:hypothetical protein [Rathayibacter toxicus]QWL49100.1 hypothetical protein E2R43_05385 [Rathayibacter toxicus]QWL53499.1 hypothetical protein E2R45_05390 [Rathayibacter toxicus]